MEDRGLAKKFNLSIGGKNYPIQLFGVFDGHGGDDVSTFVRDGLLTQLSEALCRFNSIQLTTQGIFRALKSTFAHLHKDLENVYAARVQGTTATIAMILDDKLWTANVGDSRTVLDNAGTPIQLTEDARPTDSRYEENIKKRGGKVHKNGRIAGTLASGRAIGDYNIAGVNPLPKITFKSLSEIKTDSHLILGSDGIFDLLTTSEVVSYTHDNRSLDTTALARNICASAYNCGSEDNLSVLVVKIK